MENHQIILQDEHKNRHKIVRVQDVSFNTQTLMNTYQWLWVFAESSEFFPFELWEKLNQVKVHETIFHDHKKFKVVNILKIKKLKYS
ncbi:MULTISPECIES: hypothetical protein [unclassified Acinetobacter]|uniref:hypothetical protein n=1 Tax=unclassified Acinetobacter TaxID=196816 RepID=UPI00190D107B|nr:MULTISPECIES: hypothetical protein [unclassified Acinetobacter]MBK0064116.1 hypothetical protein [Acinetobacter sp. S55]MBK0067375.1 hypothetical protein [Acinetobacter sp. S54]